MMGLTLGTVSESLARLPLDLNSILQYIKTIVHRGRTFYVLNRDTVFDSHRKNFFGVWVKDHF